METLIRPAFSSPLQKIAFTLLLVFAISLPALITASGLILRRHSYEIMSEGHGAYSYIGSEIFEDRRDIDILFVGSSIQWNAVDTIQVQRTLHSLKGTDLRVVSFGFNFNGIDIPYFLLRDLLERKKVRLVIFSLPRLPLPDGPNATAFKFFRYNEYTDISRDLPIKYNLAHYASSVLRSPRDILTMARENRSNPSRYVSEFGSNKELMGMGRNPETFVPFIPNAPLLSPEELLFSPATLTQFTFEDRPLPEYHDHYLNAMYQLLQEHQTPLAILNVPQYNERSSDGVLERVDWSRRFGKQIPLIGIAPAVLFEGLSPSEVELLHCDIYHFNKNGNEYFTKAVMPAIVDVYEKYASK